MRIALAVPFLLLFAACSGALVTSRTGGEGRFRHRELGYEIADPSVLSEPGWKISRLEDADLLVRHPEGSLWALASTCRETRAPLRVLAGELARATGGTATAPPTPVRLAGLDGLTQRLERVEDGQRLQIKTVTVRGAHCTYDWVMIAPSEARLRELEGRFDAWWHSFVPGPGASVERGTEIR
jgi:hypothetical protein